MKCFNFTKLWRTLLLAAVLVVGAVCVSNGQTRPPELAGRWIHYEGDTEHFPVEIELFSDGTGIIKSSYQSAYDGTKYENSSITWKAENKRLRLLSPTIEAIAADYEVSGYELILVYGERRSAKYIKKENFEEYKKKKAEAAKKEEEQRLEALSSFSYFTDSRNGQNYRSVKMGDKTWMAQNLNYQTGNSWCYGGDNSNCKKYGRLYDWNTAKTACPSGWRLPSREEWNGLVSASGGENVAGKRLKSKKEWNENSNGTNEYGFSALPGGSRGTDGSFKVGGKAGYWWGASEYSSDSAYLRGMGYNVNVNEYYNNKGSGFSVRCIQDE